MRLARSFGCLRRVRNLSLNETALNICLVDISLGLPLIICSCRNTRRRYIPAVHRDLLDAFGFGLGVHNRWSCDVVRVACIAHIEGPNRSRVASLHTVEATLHGHSLTGLLEMHLLLSSSLLFCLLLFKSLLDEAILENSELVLVRCLEHLLRLDLCLALGILDFQAFLGARALCRLQPSASCPCRCSTSLFA